MKLNALALAAVLAGHGALAAFSGTMAAGPYVPVGGDHFTQVFNITDHATGSRYSGLIYDGFDGCAGPYRTCLIGMFVDPGDAGYNFFGYVWRNPDTGCHYFDFAGALDAGTGHSCGSLPADFTAPKYNGVTNP